MYQQFTKRTFLAAGLIVLAASQSHAALIHYWPFDGSEANVISGGVQGSLLNGAGFTASEVAPGIGSTHALNLNGSGNQEFSVSGTPEQNALQATFEGDFTVSFWARSNLNAADLPVDIAQMFDFGTTHGNGLGVFFNRSHGSFQPLGQISLYSNGNRTSGVEGLANQWYHIAMQRDGTSVNVFVDGELQSSHTVNSPAIDNTNPFVIGGEAKSANRNWRGQIDDFGIFDAPLSSDEVRALVSIAAEPGLEFDLGTMAALFGLHDIGSSSMRLELGDAEWGFDASDFMQSLAPGTLGIFDDRYYLNLTGTSGVAQLLTVPEPGTIVLVGMLLPAGWYFQRLRKRRAGRHCWLAQQ